MMFGGAAFSMLIMLIPFSMWTIWQPFQKQHASDVVNRRKRNDVFTCARGIVAFIGTPAKGS
jgi:hypothetical protein